MVRIEVDGINPRLQNLEKRIHDQSSSNTIITFSNDTGEQKYFNPFIQGQEINVYASFENDGINLNPSMHEENGDYVTTDIIFADSNSDIGLVTTNVSNSNSVLSGYIQVFWGTYSMYCSTFGIIFYDNYPVSVLVKYLDANGSVISGEDTTIYPQKLDVTIPMISSARGLQLYFTTYKANSFIKIQEFYTGVPYMVNDFEGSVSIVNEFDPCGFELPSGTCDFTAYIETGSGKIYQGQKIRVYTDGVFVGSYIVDTVTRESKNTYSVRTNNYIGVLEGYKPSFPSNRINADVNAFIVQSTDKLSELLNYILGETSSFLSFEYTAEQGNISGFTGYIPADANSREALNYILRGLQCKGKYYFDTFKSDKIVLKTFDDSTIHYILGEDDLFDKPSTTTANVFSELSYTSKYICVNKDTEGSGGTKDGFELATGEYDFDETYYFKMMVGTGYNFAIAGNAQAFAYYDEENLVWRVQEGELYIKVADQYSEDTDLANSGTYYTPINYINPYNASETKSIDFYVYFGTPVVTKNTEPIPAQMDYYTVYAYSSNGGVTYKYYIKTSSNSKAQIEGSYESYPSMVEDYAIANAVKYLPGAKVTFEAPIIFGGQTKEWHIGQKITIPTAWNGTVTGIINYISYNLSYSGLRTCSIEARLEWDGGVE